MSLRSARRWPGSVLALLQTPTTSCQRFSGKFNLPWFVLEFFFLLCPSTSGSFELQSSNFSSSASSEIYFPEQIARNAGMSFVRSVLIVGNISSAVWLKGLLGVGPWGDAKSQNEGSDYPHFVTRSLSGIMEHRWFVNVCMIFKYYTYLIHANGKAWCKRRRLSLWFGFLKLNIDQSTIYQNIWPQYPNYLEISTPSSSGMAIPTSSTVNDNTDESPFWRCCIGTRNLSPRHVVSHPFSNSPFL